MNQLLNCIMLIDDDTATNFLHHMIIEQSNLARQCTVMDSAAKALQYLEIAGKSDGDVRKIYMMPDLIFLDINMPRNNGWDFLEAYKKMSLHQKQPVIIMLTTSPNPDDETRALNIPAVAGFENKPITDKILEKLIEKHFN